MARSKTQKRLVAEEYCRKFSKTAHLQLAKLIYKENAKLYKDIEDARGFVRIVRITKFVYAYIIWFINFCIHEI